MPLFPLKILKYSAFNPNMPTYIIIFCLLPNNVQEDKTLLYKWKNFDWFTWSLSCFVFDLCEVDAWNECFTAYFYTFTHTFHTQNDRCGHFYQISSRLAMWQPATAVAWSSNGHRKLNQAREYNPVIVKLQIWNHNWQQVEKGKHH